MTTICIKSLLEKAAESLGTSFKRYDPCRDSKNYDPPEDNVSLHIAHVMLSAGFAVFGQAHFPLKTKDAQQLDCLGISPDNKWFLACEFKRLWSAKLSEQLGGKFGMLRDVKRLEKFWIRARDTFPNGLYDPEVCRTAENCKCGWGLVGGLYFVRANDKPPLLEFWEKSGKHKADVVPHGRELAEKLDRLKAEWVVVPLPEYPTGNRYHLLGAFFQIRQICGD